MSNQPPIQLLGNLRFRFNGLFFCNRPVPWFACKKLKNDQRIVLKPTKQNEFQSIVEILNGLSAESQYLRFGQKQLSPERIERMAQQIAAESSSFGAGWIAYCLQSDGSAEPIGMARYIESSDGTAEVAFTVVDAYQGLGLGGILWNSVVRSAKRAKVSYLVAHVNPKNYRMQSLVHSSGSPFSTDYFGQTITMTVNIC